MEHNKSTKKGTKKNTDEDDVNERKWRKKLQLLQSVSVI